MSSLRVVHGLIRSLFSLVRETHSLRPAKPNVKPKVEQLEDRAAPGSLASLTETLGSGGWARNALSDFTFSWDSAPPANEFSPMDRLATGPAPTIRIKHAWDASQKTPSVQDSPLFRQQPIGNANGGEAAAGGDVTSVVNRGSGTALTIHPLISTTVMIEIPSNGSNVPGGGTFSAFGYVNPGTATMTGWVTDSKNKTYNGTAITPILPFQWGFTFSEIPTGSRVMLTVQGVANGSTGSQTITITPT